MSFSVDMCYTYVHVYLLYLYLWRKSCSYYLGERIKFKLKYFILVCKQECPHQQMVGLTLPKIIIIKLKEKIKCIFKLRKLFYGLLCGCFNVKELLKREYHFNHHHEWYNARIERKNRKWDDGNVLKVMYDFLWSFMVLVL